MGKLKVSHYKRTLLISIVAIVIVVAGIWLIRLNRDSVKNVSTSTATASQAACSIKNVPEKFCAEAKATGYYCPSWGAKPGQVVSDICYKIK
jgi:hypothetical protein